MRNRQHLINSLVRKSVALACTLIVLFAAGQTHAQSQYRHGQYGHSQSGQSQYGQGIARPAQSPAERWIMQAADKREYKSKSEVVREVKRRFDARVLKISLNEKRGIYQVRILMPDGKVRNISVNALR